jgi:nucleoside-diphosphate-sugar epimerase
MDRIVLIGRSSFIAKAIAAAAIRRDVKCLALPHGAALDDLGPDDRLINFALAPAYRTSPYDEAVDCDLKAARAAAGVGAHFLMLSTRRVYSPQDRWNAREDGPATGDETAYGRNKAQSEAAIRDTLDGRAGIFRLSNIFGYEYDPASPRRSFLGILLGSLKNKNKMYFDMSATTRRDFLPVEICAQLLIDRALERVTGTWNLGSGIALACGDLAGWIAEGHGGGTLICEPDVVRDEFCLSMDKWRAQFALPVTKEMLRDYCVGLGRRLKCGQS